MRCQIIMNIKIGNVILLFLMVFAAHAKEFIQLELTDMQNLRATNGALGQSFLLRVKVEGDIDLKSLIIPGMDQFYVEPRGNYKKMFSVNGKASTTVEQNYLLRPKKDGYFKIGPVMVRSEQGIHQSNTVSLEISDKFKDGKPQQKSADVIVTCVPDTDTAYVGQKIRIKLTMFTRLNVKIEDIKLPKLDSNVFELSELRADVDGQQELQGKEYKFRSWVADLIVRKPGKWLIPESQVSCHVHQDRNPRSSFFDQFLIHMGIGEEKKFYSDGFILTIKPLPDDSKKIDAIGSFSSYQAYLDKDEIKQSEAVTFMLKLMGNGTIEHMKHPVLILPEGFKYYPARSQITQEEEQETNYFEYIIQGLKPGQWTIEGQQFSFFDPENAEYKTLTTEALKLHVLPGVAGSSTQVQEQYDQKNVDDIMPINTTGPWYPTQEKEIPLPWFLLLTSIPIVYAFVRGLYWLINYIRMKNEGYIRYKCAFASARKKVKELEKENKVEKLYDVMLQLFAERTRLPLSQINQRVIESLLQKAGASAAMMSQWHEYFYQLQSISFAQQSMHAAVLFDMTYAWLKKLEEIV